MDHNDRKFCLNVTSVAKNVLRHNAVCPRVNRAGADQWKKYIDFCTQSEDWIDVIREAGFLSVPDGLCHALQLLVIAMATQCLSLFVTGRDEQGACFHVLLRSFSVVSRLPNILSPFFFFTTPSSCLYRTAMSDGHGLVLTFFLNFPP